MAKKPLQRKTSELCFTQDQLDEYEEAFNIFDADKDGKITMLEFEQAMTSIGREVLDHEWEKILGWLDKDMTGTIEFSEFLVAIARMLNEVDTEEELVEIFRVLDQDGDGVITKTDLRECVRRVGSSLTNQDMEEMIEVADKTGDGEIEFEEFLKIITARVV